MKISVVVPAYNEERLLAESLRHIRGAMAAFTRDGAEAELIVCDNNSTDHTAEIARAAGARVVFEPVNQIARARNTGAAAATGDWLVFVDADSYPTPELFARVLECIRSGRYIAGGSTVKLDGHHPIANFVAWQWNWVSLFTNWLAGSFIFCDAAVFRAVGGFSHELFVTEEIDLSKRFKAHARTVGKKMIVLRGHPLLTSDRKTRLYSLREHARFAWRLFRSGGRVMKDRDACHPWYDGRR